MSLNPASLAKSRDWPHGSQLTCCRFVPAPSATEADLVAAGHDGGLHLFSIEGKLLASRAAHRGWIEGLCWTPDGRTLLTADSWGQLRAWNRDWAANAADLAASTAAAPRNSGSNTAPTSLPTTAAGTPLWSVENACGSWLRDMAVSGDGRLVAVCGNEPVVRVYAVADGKLVHELRGHDQPVYSVVFSPDGASLVSGDLRGGLIDWNPRTGQLQRRLAADRLFKTYYQYAQGGVRSMTFDGAGTRLYCGGFEGTNANQAQGNPLVLVLDWKTGTIESTLSPTPALNGPIMHVAWHPSGSSAGSAPAPGSSAGSAPAPGSSAGSAPAPGWIIASGSSEGGGVLWVWRVGETAVVHHVKSPTSLRRFDIASDGVRLAVAAFGNLDGQRGGNGRRLDKDGNYPDFGGLLALYLWS
jgi:WD40 repeat protein